MNSQYTRNPSTNVWPNPVGAFRIVIEVLYTRLFIMKCKSMRENVLGFQCRNVVQDSKTEILGRIPILTETFQERGSRISIILYRVLDIPHNPTLSHTLSLISLIILAILLYGPASRPSNVEYIPRFYSITLFFMFIVFYEYFHQ